MGRSLFKLTPVSQRRMVGGVIRRTFYPDMTVNEDDNYIYYLLMRNAFLFTAVFSVLYGISSVSGHPIDLYFMTISVDPDDRVMSVGYAFSQKVAPLVMAVFLPYAWLLFRANIDMRTFDLLKRNPKFAARVAGDRWKIIKPTLIGIVGFPLVMFGAFCGPGWVLDHHLATKDSSGLLVLSLLVYPVLFGGSITIFTICASLAYQHWRRLGPYYNNIERKNAND